MAGADNFPSAEGRIKLGTGRCPEKSRYYILSSARTAVLLSLFRSGALSDVGIGDRQVSAERPGLSYEEPQAADCFRA